MEESTRPAVLAVEDNAFSQALIRATLSREFDLRVVATLSEAREWLAGHHPALILLDGRLPDGTGVAFARELRARDDLRDVRIIATTASAMVGDEHAFLAAGCDRYVSKPFRPNELIALVREETSAAGNG